MATLDIGPSDVNDADERNAKRLARRHVPDSSGRCVSCGGRYPCVPERIAETVLRTCATRA